MLVSYIIYDYDDLPKSIKQDYEKSYFSEEKELLIVEHDGVILEVFEYEGFRIYIDPYYLEELIYDIYNLGLNDGKTGNYVE